MAGIKSSGNGGPNGGAPGGGEPDGNVPPEGAPLEALLEVWPSIMVEEELPGVKAPSDGNNRRFNRNPSQIKSPDWDLGWTDGRYGQPEKTRLALIEAETELNAAAALTKAERELAASDAKSKSLDRRLKYLEPRVGELQKLFDETWEKRARSRQEYSMPLAILYLVFAAGLFMADVPLTVRLVASGFGLGPGGAPATSQGATLDIFRTREALLQFAIDNWLILVLALGLMLLGVFVKIFLDKVILCEPEERAGSRLTYALTVTFFVGVAVMYALAFVKLGYYREDQLRINDKLAVVAAVDEDLNSQRQSGQAVGPALRQQMIDARVKELEAGRSVYASPVFILLTLLFPVVGGVCFAVGARRFYRARLFREVRGEFESTRKELERAAIERGEIEYVLKAQAEELERKQRQNAARDKQAEFRKGVYLHGYERGSRMRRTLEEGESLYERCESLVLTKLAQKARASLWEQKNGHSK
jgi:hypothetical protein